MTHCKPISTMPRVASLNGHGVTSISCHSSSTVSCQVRKGGKHMCIKQNTYNVTYVKICLYIKHSSEASNMTLDRHNEAIQQTWNLLMLSDEDIIKWVPSASPRVLSPLSCATTGINGVCQDVVIRALGWPCHAWDMPHLLTGNEP